MVIRTCITIVFSVTIATQSIGQPAIDYGSHDGRYVQVFDTRLYYEEYGEGPPVILLHGGLGSIAAFSNIIPELAAHFRVIAIDSPGHSRSYGIDSLSYQIIAKYIAETINQLSLDSVSVVGYSDGAIVGMLVAHALPVKVKKLVFGAGALAPGASTPTGIGMLRSFSPEILPPVWEETYRRKSPNPDYWEQFVYDSKDMWLQEVWIPEDILPGISSGVLVLFGDRDPFIPLEHTLKIYNAIPGSQLCIMPGAAHDVFNAENVIQFLLDFLMSE